MLGIDGAISLRLLLAAATLECLAGCATELRMQELRDPNQPTATVRYSAVRHETRRFPDYSAIDKSILDEGARGADGPKPSRSER